MTRIAIEHRLISLHVLKLHVVISVIRRRVVICVVERQYDAAPSMIFGTFRPALSPDEHCVG
jgi:hypothetical protein